MGRAVGIDLGTTYSAVATIDDSGNAVVLNNAEGKPITPSVVFFSDTDGGDEPLVGDMAKNMAGSAPDNVVQFVKRQMGNPSWSFDSPSGQSYNAEEVSAIILKRLKHDAEMALGEPVTDAVITVPAYFDDARRTATKQAGKIAGFNVMRVLNEPTAAALAYGLDRAVEGNVLVYDLGGGTFDVTILKVGNQVLEVLATDGDRNLGGFDFDNAIMTLVAEEVAKQGGEGLLDDYQATAALREQAETAKRALTTTEKTMVFVTFNGKTYKVSLTRKQFEKATDSLLSRTSDLVKDVMDEAHLNWNQIDYLLLIGGSSRMPMVHEMMQKLTGKVPQGDANPDEDVAKGAAMQALLEVANGNASSDVSLSDAQLANFGSNGDIVVQDVTSQALGTITWDPATRVEQNAVIIPRNSHIPGSYSDTFYTVADNQTELHVEVTQGDDPDPNFVVRLGESTLKIPPYPANSPVRITYHYDIDQTVQIEVTDLVTNQSLGMFEIDRSANMNDAEVNIAMNRLAQMQVD